MSDREAFIDWWESRHYDNEDREVKKAAWCAWQAAREQDGGEAVGWGPKPNKPGRYAVRGFDSSGTEALVCVAYDDGQLVCNLHDSNSDPLRKFSNLMSEISNKFEWAELYSAPLTEDADDLPIVWIDPENIRRTMIASPGEAVEVSAYREGEFTAPLYTHPPQSQGVPEGWRLVPVVFTDDMESAFHSIVDIECDENLGAQIMNLDTALDAAYEAAPAAPQADKWAPYYEYPEIGKPVLGYHPDWVDEDFCPDGVRECFTFGDGTEWQSARWDGYSDLWVVEDGAPTLWIKHPQPPEQEDTP